MLAWLNDNSGALTAIITAIYVIATIFICIFNGRSAISAKKQIVESCRQQKQNAGIQLYALRKQAMERVKQEKYNEVYWDIPILFGGDINDEFNSLTSDVNKLHKLQNHIDHFGQRLKEHFDENIHAEFRSLLTSVAFSAEKEMAQETLYKFCDQHTFTQYCEDTRETITFDYRKLAQRAIELNRIIQGKQATLFLKMQEFVRESIA